MLLRTLVLAVLLAVVIAACAGPPPEVPLGPDGTADPVLVTGRDIFGARCSRCHGSSGGGGAGPRLHGSDFDNEFSDLESVEVVIFGGRKRMPSFSSALTADEITAVARYVREVL